MSDIETVITASKQIEKMLEARYGARGRGLHDKLTSVQHLLPDHIVKRARFIASVRNGIVHGDESTIRDRAGFESATQEVTGYLNENTPKGIAPSLRRQPVPRRAHRRSIVSLAAMTVGLALVIFAVMQAFALK